MDINKIKALAEAAVANGADQTVAQKGGGGDYTPPPAGPCRLRLISYIEVGKHEKEFKGQKKTQAQVELTFEVSGPKHPPREVEGKKLPHLIVVRENLSLNEKARFFKLAQLLNWEGKYKHTAQAIGDPFRGEIIHRTYKKRDGSEGVVAELYDKVSGSFKISPPRVEDAETGDWKTLTVDPAITPLRCFIWDHPDMESWASLFIEGEYQEERDEAGKVTRPARSKNLIQNKIKAAVNFPGSPIAVLLAANGQSLDLPDAERPDVDDAPDDDDAPAAAPASARVPTGAAADDALAGVV